MTLDVYIEIYNEKILVSRLDFTSLEILHPVFEQFRLKTSVRLSEYDDAVFSPNHSFLLSQLIDIYFKNRVLPEKIYEFYEGLKLANNDGASILRVNLLKK